MDSLNRAISLYVGWDVSSFPKEDSARVFAAFGSVGDLLVLKVKTLLEELNGFKVDWSKFDLLAGSEWAVAQLRERHPEIDDEGAKALVWIYSWWWK